MRIVGGEYKGRRITVPANFPSRPTTDFAKEGLFNVLEHQLDLSGFKILDLCSGTGNIGLEFVSRGAREVICIDNHINCLKFIQKNASSLGVNNKIKTIKGDVLNYIQHSSEKFDLIFADPPYAYMKYQELISIIFERNLIDSDSFFVLEHSKQKSFETEQNFAFLRNYGNVTFSFFKRS